MKAERVEGDESYVSFRCPGCKRLHIVPFTGPKAWQFNGDYEKPTIIPSIRCTYREFNRLTGQHDSSTCHLHVKDGMLEFLGDCTHELRDKTVPMVDLPQPALVTE